MVGLPDRIGDGVGQAVIHGAQARRGGIAEVGELHGRQPAGKELQAIVAGVAGQVHEHVGRIRADRLFDRSVGPAGEMPPDRRALPQPLARGVDRVVIVVEDDLKLIPVEVGQQRLDEIGHGMPAKIGRKEGDAQAPPGIRVSGRQAAHPLGGRLLHEPPILQMLNQQRLAGKVVPVIQEEQAETARLMMARTQRQMGVKIRQGLFRPLQGQQRLRPGEARLGAPGFDLQHPILAREGLGAAAAGVQDGAQAHPALGEVRLDRDGAAEAGHRLLRSAGHHIGRSQIRPGLRIAGRQFQGRLQGFHRLGVAAEGAQRQPEAHEGRRRARQAPASSFQQHQRLAGTALLLAQGAQQMVDLKIIRRPRPQRLIKAGGLVETLGQMVGHRGLEPRLLLGG